ncbi:YggS family pyridoxal phosphate-dependent enzyme [Allokutzneria sp. A3M-2-11 16]|uniref:YggS family pyridoxal phosphate-dependent enzyme n=1 Tax=Allokutzneria sp. A3M-2-11 16 TaxID=2962043 RepID=UPI0020B86491|nr:YggS family pyridoxal phosphate-dependent enzyme [Allokutzneria sp. A3M-2-11 16]MCP3797752.1 YggS family pyridoxal phosphate-dependent enzyme [Allokutzneria sp. A3M-2-11 16]
MTDDRRAELAEALAGLRARIDAACAAAGRRPGEVRLLPVTKTFPAADIALLTELGMTEFGENRDQEARAKAEELRELAPRLHMIGNVQRNKARSVTRWASVVQTVDSPRLADAFAKAVAAAREAGERDGPLEVLIQASIDGDPARGGSPLPELPALADHVARSEQLQLRGVMTVAPRFWEPERAFAALAESVAKVLLDHPNAVEVSAGMSQDLEAAIAHGSTSVRVGTSLLGGRRLASL